jgi:hypothetical protein
MRRLFADVFHPPSAVDDAQGSAASEFAVLPQSTQRELTNSEAHSKLDWVLTFLMRDVGYALLDDVRPSRGGGVQLREPLGPGCQGQATREERYSKLPTKGETDTNDFEDESTRTATPQQGVHETSQAHFLDDAVRKLLDEAAVARRNEDDEDHEYA